MSGVRGFDLELLAYGIADMPSRNECPIDVAAADFLPELPGFIAAITRNATRED